MNKRLITSALPYVNNVPHLGNLIQVLSADVFARFCRSRGYKTLYVCGTDEYGTATETRALEEKKSPQQLCDYYHAIHKDIYSWFGIAFDHFGRTSTPQQTEITQSIFKDLDRNGYITEHVSKQLYCPKCDRFLADRYVRGTCPKCGYEDARGDQCEHCGSLLDPSDLKAPKCSTCASAPEIRETKHLYIDLPKIQPKYQKWMEEAAVKGSWASNAVQMTRAWLRDGLKERAITRDLKWGIPVPKKGFENKVFYVWFDAPIGYISITKSLADCLKSEGKKSFDWKSWWLPEESEDAEEKSSVDLFQFIGKDNIPFHTVIFPSSLIGSGRSWTKLYHMSSTEYLNYESGKFSKSKGVGVFGSDAKESGIPADAWRFYIFYNRPEKADTQFTWKDFQEKYNGELIGNLGNLVNRTLLFVNKYYEGKIPDAPVDEDLWTSVREKENKITELLEWAELKDAFHEIFAISDIANKAFQAGEPWKTRNSDPEKAAKLIHNLCYVIKDLIIMLHPYLPQYAQKVASFLGKRIYDRTMSGDVNFSGSGVRPESASQSGGTALRCGGRAHCGGDLKEGCDNGALSNDDLLSWTDLGKTSGLNNVFATEVYFSPLDNKAVDSYRERYSGVRKDVQNPNATQQSKTQAKAPVQKDDEVLPAKDQPSHFNKNISLKVAKVISVEPNPDSDKLYIEHLDDGSGNDRVIQSGLVPYLKPDQILGQHIILVDNLKPRKMRGVESRGMLLAADYKTPDGKEAVELVTAPWAKPGTSVILEGADPDFVKPEQIDAAEFFKIEINVEDHAVGINGVKLLADGKPILTQATCNGGVH
ncbi:methionine--tRNA ligase [Treponema parvum]|uniref:methionine--tRNA ligase n=1 Tax=Treponema parvum TaxID=138851 RepID=UPI00211F1CC6|nr:methionine--tRNA ligase [Treponema parvum]